MSFVKTGNHRLLAFLARTWFLLTITAVMLVLTYYLVNRTSLLFCSQERLQMRMVKDSLAPSLSGMKFDDPELIQHIKRTLVPPSAQPYNLHDITDKRDPYNVYQTFETWKGAVQTIARCFKDVRNGFFVEAGALDGEYLSNTLRLEKDHGWTGLLVEPGKEMFQEILMRHRKAWHSNSCIATKAFPHQAELAAIVNKDLMLSGQSSLKESKTLQDRLKIALVKYETIQCYPIASIILALNVTKVDFFSLDVEDVENDIIDNFPFDRIDVEVWFIEHHMVNQPFHSKAAEETDPSFVQKFTSRGYSFYKMRDYVFIKKGSRYHEFFLRNKPYK